MTGNMARAASHCHQAQANLDDLALIDCPELLSPTTSLRIESLKDLSFDRLSNVLRLWLRKNKVRMPSTVVLQRIITEVIKAKEDAMPLVVWDEVQVRRYRLDLYLDKRETGVLPVALDWPDFPSTLRTNNLKCVARRAKQGIKIPHQSKVQIRFRQGGEVIQWHGQTKQLKKLVQEWGVPPWLREKIPLIYVDDQLAAVAGYIISDLFYSEQQDSWEVEVVHCST